MYLVILVIHIFINLKNKKIKISILGASLESEDNLNNFL